jgi:uncharacterized membrane protein YbhN (UPF0104 family)
MDSGTTPLQRLIRIAGTVLILGGIGWGMQRLVDSGILTTLRNAGGIPLLASLAATAGAHLMLTGRWWALTPGGHGYARMARINFESHFWATFVPGGVVKDGYRLLSLTRRGADFHGVAASIIVDRTLGLTVILLLLGPGLVMGSSVVGSDMVVPMLIFVSVLALTLPAGIATVAWAPIRRGRLRWLPPRLRVALGGIEDALGRYRQQPGRIAGALGFGLAYHGSLIGAYALAGRAIGVDLSLAHWFIVVLFTSITGTLPINIGGIGVREATIVLLLVAFAVSPAQAGAIAIVVGGFQLALSCLGGLLQLLPRHKTRDESNARGSLHGVVSGPRHSFGSRFESEPRVLISPLRESAPDFTS